MTTVTTINGTEWLQINTTPDDYIYQNCETFAVYIRVQDDQPAPTDLPTVILKPLDAISSGIIEGMVWAKYSQEDYSVQVETVKG